MVFHMVRQLTVLRAALVITLIQSTAALPALASDDVIDGPIKIAVPFAAGGAGDVVARLFAQRLGKIIQQPVIVDNRPGAGMVVASQYVLQQPADGKTILLVSSAKLITKYLYPNLGFDPLKDFSTLVIASETPLVFVVPSSLGVGDLKSLAKLVAAEPGKHSFGSAGNGVAAHITGASFALAAGGRAEHVPYRGEVPALTDLVAGRLTYQAPTVASAAPLIQAGKLVGLGVTSERRTAQLPDVPTMAEAGFPAFSSLLYSTWLALEVRADTNPRIETYLRSKLNEALGDQEVKEQFERLGIVPMPIRDGEQTRKLIDELARQMEPIVKASGAKAE
jgi:tripartite-type tricarboxylate transporter receptor subunit TctC